MTAASLCFFELSLKRNQKTFCSTSRLTLKQLDNPLSIFLRDSTLTRAASWLTIQDHGSLELINQAYTVRKVLGM